MRSPAPLRRSGRQSRLALYVPVRGVCQDYLSHPCGYLWSQHESLCITHMTCQCPDVSASWCHTRNMLWVLHCNQASHTAWVCQHNYPCPQSPLSRMIVPASRLCVCLCSAPRVRQSLLLNSSIFGVVESGLTLAVESVLRQRAQALSHLTTALVIMEFTGLRFLTFHPQD